MNHIDLNPQELCPWPSCGKLNGQHTIDEAREHHMMAQNLNTMQPVNPIQPCKSSFKQNFLMGLGVGGAMIGIIVVVTAILAVVNG